MKSVVIDGRSIGDMRDIHEAFRRELVFPDYYGNNLDALHDCLSDVHEELEIYIENEALLEEKLPTKAGRLLKLLTELADKKPNIKIYLN